MPNNPYKMSTEFYASTQFFGLISKLQNYTAQRRTTIHLTQTEQCFPAGNLASSSQIGDPATCTRDVIVLNFRDECQDDSNQSHITYLFDSNTLFASGRNVLFFAALDRRPGYSIIITFLWTTTSLSSTTSLHPPT